MYGFLGFSAEIVLVLQRRSVQLISISYIPYYQLKTLHIYQGILSISFSRFLNFFMTS